MVTSILYFVAIVTEVYDFFIFQRLRFFKVRIFHLVNECTL